MTAKLIHVTRDSTSFVGMTFPPLSGLLFLIGSWLFWPTIFDESENTAGAILYVVGALMGLIVQSNELWRFRAYIEELERDEQHQCAPIRFYSLPSAPNPDSADYKYKHHAHAIHISFIAAHMYLLGTVLYLVGAVLFFPQFPEYYLTHAAWIIITGACLNCAGATFDYNSGWDSWEQSQRQTPPEPAAWPWASISPSVSVVLYFVANATFGIGAIFFFPVIMDRHRSLEYTGITLFILGSLSFLLAALLDVMLLLAPAPQSLLQEDTSLIDSMSKRDPNYSTCQVKIDPRHALVAYAARCDEPLLSDIKEI